MKRFLYWQIRLLVRPLLGPPVPIALQRFWFALVMLTTRGARKVAVKRVTLDGVSTLKLTPAAARPQRALLYLHGGAYLVGGPASYRRFASRLGHVTGRTTFLPDYRLAPEHPFPAALDDAVAAYRALLAQGWAPDQVAIAGDSAGGGLTLATALTLRQRQLPLPAALVVLSPFVDLTLAGESHRSKSTIDPALRAGWLVAGARHYAAGRKLDDPLLSPLFGDLTGLPPMLIQVGSEEILLSDSERLAQRAQAAGVRVTLSRFEGLWHVFQFHAGLLPESDRALAEIGEFARA